MTDKSKTAVIARKIFVSAALITVLGIFLTAYYFIYIPKQQSSYNKSSFRILNSLAENFTERVDGYVKASNNNDTATSRALNITGEYNTGNFKEQLDKAITGTATDVVNNHIRMEELSDSIFIGLNNEPSRKAITQSVKDILDPIIAIHGSVFESVLLARLDTLPNKTKEQFHSSLLYKSDNLPIDEEVNTDSLFSRKTTFTVPIIQDVTIEGLHYKLFLLPFRLRHIPLLLGGFISAHDYKINSQDFPAGYLLLVALLLVIILFSLPFLKVFLIGPQENISAKDIRSLISMLYIMPFIFMLLISAAWLYFVTDRQSAGQLKTLHDQVAENFYAETVTGINQLKNYDSLVNISGINAGNGLSYLQKKDTAGTRDLKDVYLHPSIYKNLDNVF